MKGCNVPTHNLDIEHTPICSPPPHPDRVQARMEEQAEIQERLRVNRELAQLRLLESLASAHAGA